MTRRINARRTRCTHSPGLESAEERSHGGDGRLRGRDDGGGKRRGRRSEYAAEGDGLAEWASPQVLRWVWVFMGRDGDGSQPRRLALGRAERPQGANCLLKAKGPASGMGERRLANGCSCRHEVCPPRWFLPHVAQLPSPPRPSIVFRGSTPFRLPLLAETPAIAPHGTHMHTTWLHRPRPFGFNRSKAKSHHSRAFSLRLPEPTLHKLGGVCWQRTAFASCFWPGTADGPRLDH